MNNLLEKKGFVELHPNPPKLFVELQYATHKNFTKKQQYSEDQCYVREEVAEALHDVCLELEKKGYGLCIWDAYRPLRVQKRFLELINDKNFVSKNSPHCKGIAVDVTLVDSVGKYVDMGTGFDDFSEKAFHSYDNLSEVVIERRKELRRVMEKHGFKALESEWWHYTFDTEKNYDSLDVPF